MKSASLAPKPLFAFGGTSGGGSTGGKLGTIGAAAQTFKTPTKLQTSQKKPQAKEVEEMYQLNLGTALTNMVK